jgi:hypothetical protein
MAELPTAEEMRNRLAECAKHYGGAIPPEAALVWTGYFAALLEWGLMSPSDHVALVGLLPEIPNNPVIGVFLGFESRD